MKIEECKEILKDIFENVNYWLAFAEAKNAGLLAFNIAVLALIFSLDEINILGYTIAVLVLISTFFIMLALWSRFAANWKNEDNPEENDNLLFYMDIAKYTADEFLIKIYENYLDTEIENVQGIPKYLKNIAAEIVINARIAGRKFQLFNIALKIEFFAIVIAIIMTILA